MGVGVRVRGGGVWGGVRRGQRLDVQHLVCVWVGFGLYGRASGGVGCETREIGKRQQFLSIHPSTEQVRPHSSSFPPTRTMFSWRKCMRRRISRTMRLASTRSSKALGHFLMATLCCVAAVPESVAELGRGGWVWVLDSVGQSVGPRGSVCVADTTMWIDPPASFLHQPQSQPHTPQPPPTD